MRSLFLFTNVSLDGYFEAPGHNISAFNTRDDHFDAFSREQGDQVDTVLLGKSTYEMMRAFWPTPQARQVAPDVADFMNQKLKVVASHAPYDPGWDNAVAISGDVAAEVKRLKTHPGQKIIMMGSNTLCVSLMKAGLVDEFQILVNPIVLGEGTPLFYGLKEKLDLTLVETIRFPSGKILLTYYPVKK